MLSNRSIEFFNAAVDVSKRSILKGALLIVSALAVGAPVAQAATLAPTWGTYLTPFAADSMWNSRPTNPVLGTATIPPSLYLSAFEEGAYSTGVFLASASNGPMTVTGLPGSHGLYDTDAEAYHDITIPYWPSNVVPAAGSDGHAEIVDPINKVVHSFYQLKFSNGRWMAAQHGWTRLDGRGWADPAHYFQGSRATGVAASAGLIRKHEVNDGNSRYQHALAMSMTYNGLENAPAYSFPATSSDWDAATTNTGYIPEGSLLMLPSTFNVQTLSNPAARKVAETLKVYGGYVVDRNYGVPFTIYAEIGSGLGSMNQAIWTDFDKIRQALRPLASAQAWMDGNFAVFTPAKRLNILSMRGTWQIQSGATQGAFNTFAQEVVFPSAPTRTVMVNYSTRGISNLLWSTPRAGLHYKLTAHATGDGALRFKLYDRVSKTILFDSGDLDDGESISFNWPADGALSIVYATSGMGQVSTVGGELLQID